MSSSEASNFVANYMKNATGNPANASSLLNSVITNFGENDGQALLELQAAGLPFNAVLSQQGFLTENEKRKAFSFDTAEEKTKLLDFAKRKNEDFTLKDLKIEISNMEGFEELENIVRLNNQFESTDGVGQMDNVVEFLSYYALNEMYTNSKYDQDDAAESAVNMFIKNFDTTQDTFYVPNKYEGKDLTEFGQTTDGVINKTKLIQEHYLSDFNAVAYKSSTGDVDEKELTDKMILNMKVNGEWRNTANGDSLIYGIVLADTSFAPVLNADGNELSFKINDTSDILPGGSNIALDPSKLRIANEGDVYAMNKMIEVPSEDLFTSIPNKKTNNIMTNEKIANDWTTLYQTSNDPKKTERALKEINKNYTVPDEAKNSIDKIVPIFEGDKNLSKQELIEYANAIGQIESGYKTKIQIGGGPARSYWQVEPTTALDLLNNSSAIFGPKFESVFSIKYGKNSVKYLSKLSEKEMSTLLETDSDLAVAMALGVIVNRTK